MKNCCGSDYPGFNQKYKLYFWKSLYNSVHAPVNKKIGSTRLVTARNQSLPRRSAGRGFLASFLTREQKRMRPAGEAIKRKKTPIYYTQLDEQIIL